MRIMAKYDFKIVATWESKKDNRTEFVYLLECLTGKPWPIVEKFLRDQEWIKIRGAGDAGRSSARYGSHLVFDGLFTRKALAK